jgi:5-methylcytosine-specific restriction protein B
MDNNVDWFVFYQEFAKKLLDYKDKRSELVKLVKDVFNDIQDLHLPKLEQDNVIEDIDPFTIFALFNKVKQTVGDKVKIIRAFSNRLGISSNIIPSSFKGIPWIFPKNATFYLFKNERSTNDINLLWDLYTSALLFSSDPSHENKEKFKSIFDEVINMKGNGTSKLTMALYWIDPKVFLSLDGRNHWYLYKSNLLPQGFVSSLPSLNDNEKVSAEKYLQITECCKNAISSKQIGFDNFISLTAKAYEESDSENKKQRLKIKDHHDEELEENNSAMINSANQDSLGDSGVSNPKYWIYAPGPNACKWEEFYKKGIMAIGWGYLEDLTKYASKEAMKDKMREHDNKPNESYMNDGLATWQFCHEINVGDIVYAKKGKETLVGRGIVESGYIYDPKQNEYSHIRKVKWTHKKIVDVEDKCATKTLTDITPYPETTKSYEEKYDVDPDKNLPIYTKENFLDEVYMSEEDYNSLVSLLEHKKNIILQGAPGVGKTFAAKRLAYSILKKKDPSKVKMIQFHQSYSYEDFVRGYRPTEKGFEIKNGPFYEFCMKARVDSEHKYFFIIDEINRGNLSKIFGELFMLIESDKRSDPKKDSRPSVQLLYVDPDNNVEEFWIPSNLHIIGMMNTADRSLALMDFALRRRFGFFDLKPAFENDNFEEYEKSLNNQKFTALIGAIKELNKKIEKDPSLGSGFCIGHSFFCGLGEETNNDDSCNVDIDTKLESIVKYEIKPLLQEYWFDDAEKVKNEVDKLLKVLGSNE